MKTRSIGLFLAAIATAQSPSPTKALSHFIHAVDDLDTTLAFYNNVFNLKGNPSDFLNPAVPLLPNAPGVTLRLSMLALPGGMRLELTQFKGLERKPGQAKYTDPGAGSAVFYVRDIDGALANAKKASAPIVTTGGAPVGTEYRKLSGVIPGPPAYVEFTEFRGVPRTKFHLRVRDPGAPALCIQVNDETATIGQMKAAGVNILSTDGKIVDFGGGTHTIFVEDPNGMNLEIFERPAPQGRGKQTK